MYYIFVLLIICKDVIMHLKSVITDLIKIGYFDAGRTV